MDVDFERIALIMKFVRMKRGLTQEIIAKRLGMSVPYVTTLENGIRTSLDAARMILHVLGVRPEIILDPGFYAVLQKRSHFESIPGIFAICCVIDSYCYLLTESMISKILGVKNLYIDSFKIAEIVSRLDDNRFRDILTNITKPLLPYLIAHPDKIKEVKDRKINHKAIELCVKNDPFYTILSEIGITIPDYFKTIDSLEKKLYEIRLAPLSILEQSEKELGSLDRIINLILSRL